MKKLIIFVLLILITIGIIVSYNVITRKMEERSYPLKYTEHVEKNALQYGIPSEIIYAVIKTESNFRHDAVSSRGAVGLMQIMPETFEWLFGITKEDFDSTMLYDPGINIKYGTFLLSILYKEFKEWDTVYAAYNAGIGNVKKWLENELYSQDGILTNIPFNETSQYIVKVNKAKEMYIKLYFMED